MFFSGSAGFLVTIVCRREGWRGERGKISRQSQQLKAKTVSGKWSRTEIR